jgi:pimeloyl-ACP methyl ester carboxylesterase
VATQTDFLTSDVPPHFIVIVPGYMGSKLRDKTTGKIVWVDFSTIPANPLKWEGWLESLFAKMAYPNDDLEPAGIVEDVMFVPPWAKQEQYGRLVVALEKMGYKANQKKYSEEECNLYTFSYDWRQDNRISARQLGEAVERWSAFHPGAKAWLIGHSNGGIVSRWYTEKLGGKDWVGKLILMGSPWDGAPKGLKVMFRGFDSMFRKGFNFFDIHTRTRDLVRTFPSAYQLIPVHNPFLRDLNNQLVDVFQGEGWLDDPKQRQMLSESKRFNEELGNGLSVETLCFFGRKLPTLTNGVVHFEAGSRWSDIEWFALESGDGTVPERSAVNPNAAAKLPFIVGHGDIYVNPAVLEFLRWELVDKFTAPSFATLVVGGKTINFEPDQDTFEPGQPIRVWATIADTDTGAPVGKARIDVKLAWRAALPGSKQAKPKGALPKARLQASAQTPGRYEGNLAAPQLDGYYTLKAKVSIAGENPVELDELIAVEQATDFALLRR